MTTPSQGCRPAAPVVVRDDEGVNEQFHRLALVRPRNRWWAPLLTGVVGVALYLVIMLMMLLPLMLVGVLVPSVGEAIDEMLQLQDSFDLDRPWLMLALLVPLILMIPALLLASRMVQGRGVGYLTSVVGRMRWGMLGRTLLIAVTVFTGVFVGWVLIDVLLGIPVEFRADHSGLPVMLLLVIALVPLQAAAEEYVFRGYLMQLIGRWLRHPAFAILLPVPLFVLGHGYDIWGALSVGLFAIVAGWLCWRTGGLEAAIAMHVANNVVIFVFAGFGLVDGNATTGTPVDLIVQTATALVFAAIVLRTERPALPVPASRSRRHP